MTLKLQVRYTHRPRTGDVAAAAAKADRTLWRSFRKSEDRSSTMPSPPATARCTHESCAGRGRWRNHRAARQSDPGPEHALRIHPEVDPRFEFPAAAFAMHE